MSNFTNPFQVASIYKNNQQNLVQTQKKPAKKQYNSLNTLLKENPFLGMARYGAGNIIA